MATYTWQITDMSRRQVTGAVIQVEYRCVATQSYDGTQYTQEITGSSKYQPDVDSPDFVPYEDLIEADVLAWLDTDDVESRLQARLDNEIGGRTATGVPW